MVRVYILPDEEPGIGRIIADVTGRWLSFFDEKKLRCAILETRLVEPGDCSSEHFNGDGLIGKHFISVRLNDALSEETKLRLAGVVRDTIASILSEVTVVNCTGLRLRRLH